jgi:hypothetical protein
MHELGLLVLAIPFAISSILMIAVPRICIDTNDAFLGRGMFGAPEWARNPVIMRRVGFGLLLMAILLAAVHFAAGF